MRRVFIFAIALLTFILLLYNYSPDINPPDNPQPGDGNGIGEPVEVNVIIVIDGIANQLAITKNEQITPDEIPIDSDKEIVGIYYDQNYRELYRGEPIENDITLYVKTQERAQLPYIDVTHSLYQDIDLVNNGYSGVFLLSASEQMEEHFISYPYSAESEASCPPAFAEYFDSDFFTNHSVIIVYALAAPSETNFSVNRLRKAGVHLEVNLSYWFDGAASATKYHMFVIMVDKAEISGIEKLTLSVIDLTTSQKESHYYGNPELQKEAKVTLMFAGDYLEINVPLNHTITINDIPEKEKYKEFAFYYDEQFVDAYGEPIKQNITLYAECRLKMFSVVFVVAECFKIIYVPENATVGLSDVPVIADYHYLGLYYDEHFLFPYKGEAITGNFVFFVKYE